MVKKSKKSVRWKFSHLGTFNVNLVLVIVFSHFLGYLSSQNLQFFLVWPRRPFWITLSVVLLLYVFYRGLQRDVVYHGWPIAPSYMNPNAEGGGGGSCEVHWKDKMPKIFPEKEYRGLSHNFHIHVSVNELYIPTMCLPFLLEEICGPILGIYKSLTDTWMWKLGLRPRYSQKRNI